MEELALILLVAVIAYILGGYVEKKRQLRRLVERYKESRSYHQGKLKENQQSLENALKQQTEDAHATIAEMREKLKQEETIIGFLDASIETQEILNSGRGIK